MSGHQSMKQHEHTLPVSDMSTEATCIHQPLVSNTQLLNQTSVIGNCEQQFKEQGSRVSTMTTCTKQTPFVEDLSREISITNMNKCLISQNACTDLHETQGQICRLEQQTLERGITSEGNSVKQLPVNNKSLQTANMSKSLNASHQLTQNTHSRERTAGNISSEKDLTNEPMTGTIRPIQAYSENECTNEAVLGTKHPRQMLTENGNNSNNFCLKPNVSEYNSHIDAVPQSHLTCTRNTSNQIPNTVSCMHYGLCDDPSVRNEPLDFASSLHRETYAKQLQTNEHSNYLIPMQPALKHKCFDDATQTGLSGMYNPSQDSVYDSTCIMSKNDNIIDNSSFNHNCCSKCYPIHTNPTEHSSYPFTLVNKPTLHSQNSLAVGHLNGNATYQSVKHMLSQNSVSLDARAPEFHCRNRPAASLLEQNKTNSAAGMSLNVSNNDSLDAYSLECHIGNRPEASMLEQQKTNSPAGIAVNTSNDDSQGFNALERPFDHRQASSLIQQSKQNSPATTTLQLSCNQSNVDSQGASSLECYFEYKPVASLSEQQKTNSPAAKPSVQSNLATSLDASSLINPSVNTPTLYMTSKQDGNSKVHTLLNNHTKQQSLKCGHKVLTQMSENTGKSILSSFTDVKLNETEISGEPNSSGKDSIMNTLPNNESLHCGGALVCLPLTKCPLVFQR